MYHTLRLILGDQLNEQHCWLDEKDEGVLYALMECRSETDYVRHHIQKIVGFFGAMRRFAALLREKGHAVRYLSLDDPQNRQSVAGNIRFLVASLGVQRFEYQEPDEYRLAAELNTLASLLDIPVQGYDTGHFLSSPQAFKELFKGKKTYLMESFYRKMRVKYRLLMEEDGTTPLGGRWNFDAENRKKLPAHVVPPPARLQQHDVRELLDMVQKAGVSYIGEIDPLRFAWPLSRAEALEGLDYFLRHGLRFFGTYQDAMTERHPFLYHSRLSFALNSKLIHPLEVVEAAIRYWRSHEDDVSLAQVEGFVRQIIGWREYVRGIYWAQMPGYGQMNFFGHQLPLPSWYWTGKTNMRCLHFAIGQSLEHAYAHHIQRLMLTGNFALLYGADPSEVDAWYLGIYIDALEWVEMPNTRGMSQFADGGIVGTKPYVSSANYIHSMSDYCQGCRYDPKKRYGANACPFNSMYWSFYHRHEALLAKNPRIGMAYRLWAGMDETEKQRILDQAEHYRRNIENL